MNILFKSSVEYICERSKVHSQERQGKFKTNLKRNLKEQKLGNHELFYKTGVGSGAPEG